MKQRKLLKTTMLFFCVASLGLFASCTKTDSGSGSSSGSNTTLIVGKWQCTYHHVTTTSWYDGTQISYDESDSNTGYIEEFHSDGTTNSCVYSVNGNTLTMCSTEYIIDKLTNEELNLTLVRETEYSTDGHVSKVKTVHKIKHKRIQ